MAETKPPKVFISYAWEDDLKVWVLDFATRLRSDGINAILDQWETVPGDQLPEFMEKSVRESDFVVFICTPTYKRKSDRRRGGVGYEGSIITGEVFQKNNHRKFIPVLRKGKWATASPSWAISKLFIDFRGESYSEASYQQLLNTLLGKSPTAPPLRDDRFREDLEPKAVEKVVEEKRPPEPKEEKPEPKIPKPSPEKVGVGGDVKESVIVSGSGNVINFGHRETTAPEKSQPKKAASPRKPNTAVIVALIGLVGTLFAALISSPMLANLFSPAPKPTATLFAPINTKTPAPSKTPTRAITPTTAFTPTATPYPTQITDAQGVTMRLVPAGEFTMGSSDKQIADAQKICSSCDFSDETPVHQVYLDAFYMDIYEVTNVAYKACVTAGVCSPPQNTRSYTHSSYYGNSQYDDYPVIYVDWNQAKAYCEWRGPSTGSGQAQLPTEAQWEKAARGTDGRTYPWGEGIDSNRANYNSNVGDTTEVGSYESGKSPYGMYDMAGNVWEWVADWYDSSYYANSPSSNPLGPSSGDSRVLRGGSWGNVVSYVRSANRLRVTPDNIFVNVGFRCARSLP